MKNVGFFCLIVIQSIDKHLFRLRVMDGWYFSCNLRNRISYHGITVAGFLMSQSEIRTSPHYRLETVRGHFVFLHCHLVLIGCYELSLNTICNLKTGSRSNWPRVDNRIWSSWMWHHAVYYTGMNFSKKLAASIIWPEVEGIMFFSDTFVPDCLTLHLVR